MEPKSWTIHEILKTATDFFRQKQIDSPRLCAEVLLAHQLNTSRIQLYLHYDQPLTLAELEGYRGLIRRRLKREPLQYITCSQEFWSLDFVVSPHVLIPRPESEILVEQAIALRMREFGGPQPKEIRILDIGTGCGALAIALARELRDVLVCASDVSPDALHVARLNARKYEIDEKILFTQGDLLQPMKEKGLKFDIIVSNPPYIATACFESLAPEVRDFEPRIALDGGENGLFHIRKLIAEGPDCLNPGGWILIEMSPEQTSIAMNWLDENGSFSEVKRMKDFSHRFRMVMARKRGAPSDEIQGF